nr:reverse transcriptase domain-containing protein [Tanacetum cinerariifolium]
MSTRSSTRNLFPPLDNPELTIRRRSCTDPTLLNDFEMADEGNGDLPVPDLRTIEELCQPYLNGRGGPIASISIQTTNFRLKNDMIQQVHNSCQFHGLPGDDANKHLDKFLHVTQSIKVNGVTDDALHLYLFPHSLTHHATAWFDRLSRNSINTFEQMAKMFLGKYFPPSMVTKLRNEITNFRQRPDESLFKAWEHYKLFIDQCPNHNMFSVTQIDTFYNGLTLRHRDTINAAAGGTFIKRRPKECYDLIENITAHHNDWDTSAQWSESSSSITSSSDTEIAALKAEMAEINKNLMRVLQHLDKFLHVTQSIKVNGVIDDALRLYLFPHSLTHHATAWFDRLPRNSITTFEKMAKMFLGKYFSPSMVTKLRNEINNFRQRPDESLFEAWEHYKLSIDRCPNQNMLPVTQIDTFYNGLTLRHRGTINAATGGTFIKRRPKECYDLIKNMTAHHNDWDTSFQRSESSSSITSFFDPKIVALKAEKAKINKNLMKVLQINQQVKAVAHNCETCGGPRSYNDCPATVGQTQNVYAAGAFNQGGNSYQPQAPGYQAPVHQALIPQPQVITTTEFTNYMKANDAILKNMQTNMTSLTNSNLELKNMFGQFMKINTASSSGSGTLPSNTITNPKEDLKGITTRSGNAYK